MNTSPRWPRIQNSPDVVACCGHESYCLRPLTDTAKAWTCRHLPANWDYDFKFRVDENRYDLSRDHYEYAIKRMKSAVLTIAEFEHPVVFDELLKILDDA